MKRVGLIGASGYTGLEVRRLLQGHDGMQLEAAMTARPDHVPGQPALPCDPEVEPLELSRLANFDGVFLCTPHGAAAELSRKALAADCAVVDLSGRPYAEISLALRRPAIGELACENVAHFLVSLAIGGRLTLHADVLRGENDHHKAEAVFKALALALRQAVAASGFEDIPSTKGVLGGGGE